MDSWGKPGFRLQEMKRALVVHPEFEVIGGAEQVSAHILQWLVVNAAIEVTLLSLSPVMPASLVKAGMSEEASKRVKTLLAGCPGFVRKSNGALHLLKLSYLHRSARALCREYDVCISTYNELDFGKMGIQYIHHPSFADRSFLREMKILGRRSILDRIPMADLVYRKMVSVVSGERRSGFTKNLTLVNSFFMQRVVSEVYGITGEVVYPAAVINPKHLELKPWEERALRFVTISRIAPDKDLLAVIDYFSVLQKAFPEAEFVILGRGDDPEYENLIALKAKKRGIRLRIQKGLSDMELKTLLENTKYYVHARVNEHFGIAVVQAVAAGCLVMVHDSGGPREIVQRAELRFENADDLVMKVIRLNKDPLLRSQVMSASQSGLDRFTLSAFYSHLDAVLRPLIET